MARTRTRLVGWTYDDAKQEIRAPSGRTITLHEVAQHMQDEITCRFDFKGAWSGWRMRGDRLYPPFLKRGSGSLTPWMWPSLLRMLDSTNQTTSPGDPPTDQNSAPAR